MPHGAPAIFPKDIAIWIINCPLCAHRDPDPSGMDAHDSPASSLVGLTRVPEIPSLKPSKLRFYSNSALCLFGSHWSWGAFTGGRKPG